MRNSHLMKTGLSIANAAAQKGNDTWSPRAFHTRGKKRNRINREAILLIPPSAQVHG